MSIIESNLDSLNWLDPSTYYNVQMQTIYDLQYPDDTSETIFYMVAQSDFTTTSAASVPDSEATSLKAVIAIVNSQVSFPYFVYGLRHYTTPGVSDWSYLYNDLPSGGGGGNGPPPQKHHNKSGGGGNGGGKSGGSGGTGPPPPPPPRIHTKRTNPVKRSQIPEGMAPWEKIAIGISILLVVVVVIMITIHFYRAQN